MKMIAVETSDPLNVDSSVTLIMIDVGVLVTVVPAWRATHCHLAFGVSAFTSLFSLSPPRCRPNVHH